MQSRLLTFEGFRSHAGSECPFAERVVLPKIVDWYEEAGPFTFDER